MCFSLSKLRCISHILRVKGIIPYRLLALKSSTVAKSRDEIASKGENNLYHPREKSTLYVSGSHAQRVYALLRPFLNIEHIVKNSEDVEYSISSRKLAVDFKNLLPKLKLLLDVRTQVHTIEKDLEKLKQETCSTSHLPDEETAKLRISDAIQRRKEIRNSMWTLEDEVISELLRLPNRLHPDVQDVDQILKDECIKCSKLNKSHVEIGINTSCLNFSLVSPTAYYLKGKAALLELAIMQFFANHLHNAQFSRMSGPDFSKAAIIEGCGKDLYALDECIPLSGEEGNIGQVLHLTGTASQEAFAVSFTRMMADKSSLPIRYYIDGRNYQAKHIHSLPSPNLFSVVQSTLVEYFVATEKCELESTFNDIVKIISKCYEEINLPFRVVRTSASKLHLSESLRVQFELWSPSLNKFIMCGNVSLHDDYLSKRLLMKYKGKSFPEQFLHTIGGTAVSAPVLIACIMENLQTSDGFFNIPKSLESFMNL